MPIGDWLRPCWFDDLDEEKRYWFIKSGRGAGKSHGIATWIIMECVQRPIRVACLRQVQRSIDQSVLKELQQAIDQLGVQRNFKVQHNRIVARNGGEIFFSGMSSPAEIKSWANVDIAWIEEAETASGRALTTLDNTIRKAGCRIIATWNPQQEDDPIEKFARDNAERASTRMVRYFENPVWYSLDLEENRLRDQKNNHPDYAHIWEGAHRPMGEDAWKFFERWRSCVDPALKLEDAKGWQCWLGVDAATEGDLTSVCYNFVRNGIVLQFWRTFISQQNFDHMIDTETGGDWMAWRDEGLVETTETGVSVFSRMKDVVEEADEMFDLRGVSVDPNQLLYLIEVADSWGIPSLRHPQGAPGLTGPLNLMEDLIMSGRYKREDNPCAEWQFSNVDIDHRDGGRRPVKRKAKMKIDAMDASLNAVGMMSRDSAL